MKKVLYLALGLLASLGMNAATYLSSAPEDGKIYQVVNTRSGNAASVEAGGKLTQSTLASDPSSSFSQLWQFLKQADGSYVIRNVGTAGYVMYQSLSATSFETTNNASLAGKFYVIKSIYASQTGATYWNISQTATGATDYGWNDTGATGTNVGTWTCNDAGSVWQFIAVATTDAMTESLSQGPLLSAGLYRVYSSIQPSSSNRGKLYQPSGATELKYTTDAVSEKRDLWVVIPSTTSNTSFQIENLRTAQCIANQTTNNKAVSVAGASNYVTLQKNCTSAAGTFYNVIVSGSSDTELYMNAQPSSGAVVTWNTKNTSGSSSGNTNSEWLITAVGDADAMTNAEIKDYRDEVNGWVAPEVGKIYQLYSPNAAKVIGEDPSTHVLLAQAPVDGDAAQLWRVVAIEGSTTVLFENIYTGRYIKPLNGTKSTQYATQPTLPSKGFAITENESFEFARYYNPIDGTDTGVCFNIDGSSGTKIVGWSIGNGSLTNSEWTFRAVSLTEEEIAEARAQYEIEADIIANKSKYNKAFAAYFDDYACTQMKEEYLAMSDADLTAAMESELPQRLIDIALKIKNQSWADKWEQKFRVADYKAYSDNQQWPGIIGAGYYYGQLTNPTGIRVDKGDLLFIFVDQTAASGATLCVELVEGAGNTGTTTRLQRGMNILQPSVAGNLFIQYEVSTHGSGTIASLATAKKLSDFPDITIHIEGGKVNGYFDATHGDTNEMWSEMVKNPNMLQGEACQLKGNKVLFNMNASLVKQYCPVEANELIDVFDGIIQLQHDLMGLNDTYIPGIEGRFNCMLGAYSVTYNYMFATSYGTYYNESTLSTVLNAKTMTSSGGALWGPAHENGHINQKLFNMIGCTEVSNNIYSNATVFENGVSTTRGEGLAGTFDNYAAGNNWMDLNIWLKTRMYFQLYLYYHVAGNDTEFFPKLFAWLRANPINRKQGVDTPCTSDYLHFAKACCAASGTDLTEFFRAYGMYVPLTKTTVDDYGTYYIHATQKEIDSALEFMHQYPAGNASMIFIEDRIEKQLATNPGHAEGAYKNDYSSDVAVGKIGEVGQFCHFTPEAQATEKCEGYKGTIVPTSGKITITAGSGAVGFVFFDEDFNIIRYSNVKTFTVPTSYIVGGKKYQVAACQADGTYVPVEGCGTAGVPDAIQTPTINYDEHAAPVIYDLQGRRVEKIRSAGLYIVNGKKMYCK